MVLFAIVVLADHCTNNIYITFLGEALTDEVCLFVSRGPQLPPKVYGIKNPPRFWLDYWIFLWIIGFFCGLLDYFMDYISSYYT